MNKDTEQVIEKDEMTSYQIQLEHEEHNTGQHRETH